MTTTAMECRVYGLPIDTKSYSENKDGTLTIIGVASTTNKDLANDIVSPEVLQSLAHQATKVNLHRDHVKRYEGGIGSILEAWVDDNQLWIKARILSEYAHEIKERLDIGMKFGFSISGFPRKQRTPEGMLIVDYDLKEISLTYIPTNWDTYGTVRIVENKDQNLITSNCLTGACYHMLKIDGETMSEKNETKTDPIQEEEPVLEEKSTDDAGLSEGQLNQVKDVMNEVVAELEPRIIENLRPELESIADSAANKAAEEVANRLLAEFKATEEVNSDDSELDDKDLEEENETSSDESEVIETSTEEEEVPPEEDDDKKSEPGIKEPSTEEELDTKEDSEEVDEKEKIDEKSIEQLVHESIVKQMNDKSLQSKFDKFRMEEKKTKSTSVVKPKRDSYGRNLNYV